MTPDSFDDLATDFPDPRDGEPASLRQDIHDELADHLQCSLEREQFRTQDLGSARQKVITKFGNVNQIANRLWWDAMQETIMSQRITYLLAGIMTVAMLAACTLIWQSQQRASEFQAAMLADQKAFLTGLVEKMPAPAVAPVPVEEKSATPSDWGKVIVKLVDPEGLPVQGEVTLSAGGSVPPDSPATSVSRVAEYPPGLSATAQSNSEGIADLGLFRFGAYRLFVNVMIPLPDQSTVRFAMEKNFSNRPENGTFTIVCPKTVPTETVEISLTPPPDFQRKELGFAVLLQLHNAIEIGNEQWWQTTSQCQFRFDEHGKVEGDHNGAEDQGTSPGTALAVLPVADTSELSLQIQFFKTEGDNPQLRDFKYIKSYLFRPGKPLKMNFDESSDLWKQARKEGYVPRTFELQAIKDDEGSSPAAGLPVFYNGGVKKELESDAAYNALFKDGDRGEFITDASGKAQVEFPLPSSNQILFGVEMPWGEYLAWKVKWDSAGRASSVMAEKLVVPTEPPQPAEVTFQIDIPKELQSEPLYYLIDLEKRGRTVGGRSWNPRKNDPVKQSQLLVGRDGSIIADVGRSSLRAVEGQTVIEFNPIQAPRITSGDYQIMNITAARPLSTGQGISPGERNVRLIPVVLNFEILEDSGAFTATADKPYI
ncbi:hypothetical protein [Planctomicrobium sp. SH664]|uniref:hypothetical protein n=1 Tax=Planctomicrobium sp. SH664 TaxID=3448125 RepID=UPI003F5B01C0